MSTESAATPSRLARISVAQAAGAIAETVLLGITGAVFGFVSLVLATGINIPGAASFGEYVLATTELQVYFVASGVVYIALLTSHRTRIQAGLTSPPELDRGDAESYVDFVLDEIFSVMAVSSYTASIIVIGGLLTYEVTQVSAILGIFVLVLYPYLEYYALIKSAEDAESFEDAKSPITPAILGSAAIAFGMTFVTLPLLLSLRLVGLIASLQAHAPSFEELTNAIQITQEHLVFVDRLFPSARRRSS